MDYIQIDSDKWEHAGKVWRVLEYVERPGSTGVSLVLEDAYNGEVLHCVVPSWQIKYLEARDW